MGKGKNSKEKFKNRVEIRMRAIDDFINDATIFFIGDGHPENEITSIKRAYNFLLDYLKKETTNTNFKGDLIYDEGKNFEDILLTHQKIKNSKLFDNKKQKKGSNRHLFNDIIEGINPKILINKKGELKSVLFEIFKNSNFKKIIDFIYN